MGIISSTHTSAKGAYDLTKPHLVNTSTVRSTPRDWLSTGSLGVRAGTPTFADGHCLPLQLVMVFSGESIII